MSSDRHPLATIEAPFYFVSRGEMPFVPGANRGDHAACIECKSRHAQRRPWPVAMSRRVRSTVAVRSGAALPTGAATSSRPLRSSVTASGCGSISMTPSRQRTSKGVPGSKAASRRISLGITRRPAESMVVVMVRIIPLRQPSGADLPPNPFDVTLTCLSSFPLFQCAVTACCFHA